MVTPTVVVLGEVLVEVSGRDRMVAGAPLRLGFSGDALNSAAAAAAAGARAVLVARVPDDELGDALIEYAVGLGVDCAAVRRASGQHGVYFTHADPSGRRQFAYARRFSVGSQLEPADLDDDLLTSASVVLASGVTCAISESAAAAVSHAARVSTRFVYDPNYRPRLATVEAAARQLTELAPYSWLVTPSWPDEVVNLLGTPAGTSVEATLRALRRDGVRRTALTCGADGVILDEGGEVTVVKGIAAPTVVDQTGAGDSFVGTVCGRLAVGDPLVDAVRLGVSAASLCVQGQGGTGYVPTLEEVRLHAQAAGATGTVRPPVGRPG